MTLHFTIVCNTYTKVQSCVHMIHRSFPLISGRADAYKYHAASSTVEGLQEPDRDGTQHIARDDDHRFRTASQYRRGHERFSRLFALNEWLLSWCKEQKLLFVNNWNLFWERPRLFRADGLHPSRVGAELLSDNISKTLCSI